MKTIEVTSQTIQQNCLQATRCVMALGFFDGVHLGHQKVIKKAFTIAEKKNVSCAVMSFFPHPKVVLSKGKKQVPSLMSVQEKLKRLQMLGVERCYLVHFDEDFASLPPEEFIHRYVLGLQAVHAVAGFDYTYGCLGEGNMDRMKRDAFGCLEVTKVEKITHHKEVISSSLIRKKIQSGEVDGLISYLGKLYDVQATVQIKKNNISFLVASGYLLPPDGWYEVVIRKGDLLKEETVFLHHSFRKVYLLSTQSVLFKQNEPVEIVWKRCLEKQRHRRMTIFTS